MRRFMIFYGIVGLSKMETVYRSCSELGGKKMTWVVEKWLENDIFDLSV